MKNVMEKVVYPVIQKVVVFIRKVIFVNEDFFSLCVRTFFLCVCVSTANAQSKCSLCLFHMPG